LNGAFCELHEASATILSNFGDLRVAQIWLIIPDEFFEHEPALGAFSAYQERGGIIGVKILY